jgi:hypothetical protein
MKQSRTIPPSILCSIRVRGNLAYVSAEGMNKEENLFAKQMHEDVFKARVLAYLRIISEGAAHEIERMKKGML